jgi:hypothetical protein
MGCMFFQAENLICFLSLKQFDITHCDYEPYFSFTLYLEYLILTAIINMGPDTGAGNLTF